MPVRRGFTQTDKDRMPETFSQNVERKLARYMAENPSTTAEQRMGMAHIFAATEQAAERKRLTQDAGEKLARFFEEHPPTTAAEVRLAAQLIDSAIAMGEGPDYLLRTLERAEAEARKTMKPEESRSILAVCANIALLLLFLALGIHALLG